MSRILFLLAARRTWPYGAACCTGTGAACARPSATAHREAAPNLSLIHIFMTPGLVNPFEPMQREVERLVVLHDGLVERRKQHIGAVAVVDVRRSFHSAK